MSSNIIGYRLADEVKRLMEEDNTLFNESSVQKPEAPKEGVSSRCVERVCMAFGYAIAALLVGIGVGVGFASPLGIALFIVGLLFALALTGKIVYDNRGALKDAAEAGSDKCAQLVKKLRTYFNQKPATEAMAVPVTAVKSAGEKAQTKKVRFIGIEAQDEEARTQTTVAEAQGEEAPAQATIAEAQNEEAPAQAAVAEAQDEEAPAQAAVAEAQGEEAPAQAAVAEAKVSIEVQNPKVEPKKEESVVVPPVAHASEEVKPLVAASAQPRSWSRIACKALPLVGAVAYTAMLAANFYMGTQTGVSSMETSTGECPAGSNFARGWSDVRMGQGNLAQQALPYMTCPFISNTLFARV